MRVFQAVTKKKHAKIASIVARFFSSLLSLVAPASPGFILSQNLRVLRTAYISIFTLASTRQRRRPCEYEYSEIFSHNFALFIYHRSVAILEFVRHTLHTHIQPMYSLYRFVPLQTFVQPE